MPISTALYSELACPHPRLSLPKRGENLEPFEDQQRSYPVIDGIPLLICDEKSPFSLGDYTNKGRISPALPKPRRKSKFLRLIPTMGKNIKADANYNKLLGLLPPNAN